MNEGVLLSKDRGALVLYIIRKYLRRKKDEKIGNCN